MKIKDMKCYFCQRSLGDSVTETTIDNLSRFGKKGEITSKWSCKNCNHKITGEELEK